MTVRKQQEMELEAALHGIKLKAPLTRPVKTMGADLDRQLAAGKLEGFRIREGIRGQQPKPKK